MARIDNSRSQINDRLYRIYTQSNNDLLNQIQKIISPNAAMLADYFYTCMLEIDESDPYLNHDLVSERLHRSMAEWIKSLFLPSDERSVEEHMKWQQVVGDVHARVNVPMKLVNHGIRLIKGEITNLIKDFIC